MNVFDLNARISLDSSKYADSLNSIKGAMADFAKVSTAALGAAATGVSALVKESVSAYASYEQLTGGVEKLFGDSSDLLMMYAEDAYKTVGMSTNEYMETATSFAAALTTSVQAAGGSMDEAVELADTAMRSMSDNANVFGSDMTSIQNAYQGFAKQNYTMLDNLKLGYGGTKAEMERLIKDANELRHQQGINNDLTIESFADIITAIHTVQTEMGITGTTSKEAAHTISGSMGSVKAAWRNLTVEMAKDDGDVEKAFGNLAEAAGAMIGNMLPRVEKALGGVNDLIVASIPKLVSGINKMIPKIVPSLAKAATSILGTLGSSIVENVPMLMDTAIDVVETIGDTLLDYFPDWFSDGLRNTFGSVGSFIENIDFGKLKDSLGGLGDSLEPLIEKLSGGVAWAFDNVVKPFGEWLMNDALPAGIDALAGAFSVINDALEILAPVGKAVWEEFLSPLFSAVGDLAVGSLTLLGKGLKSIGDTFKDFDTVGFIDDIDQGHFWDNWKLGMQDIGNSLELFGDDIDEFFAGPGQTWNQIWQNVGSTVFDVKKTIVDALEAIAGAIDKVTTAIEKAPSFISGYFDYMFSGEGFEDMFGKLDFGAFATGGRVTRPTLALIGENEPETVIPDSKRGEFGNTYNITVNVNGSGLTTEEQARELAELSIAQIRAIGGTGF